MIREGTYYLARVLKGRNITNRILIDAILNSSDHVRGDKVWTITYAKEFNENTPEHFVYGHLCKYEPEATVKVIDPDEKIERVQEEPNLSRASSPFIYIPEYSGFVFLKISGQIEPKHFMRFFPAIVRSSLENFFVSIELEPIVDLRKFAIKLSNLEGIYNLSAEIAPPNPMYGHLWKDLKKYLEKRKINKMKVEETSKDEPIKTNIVELVQGLVETKDLSEEKIDIGDASILMAADGYGKGYVKGKKRGKTVIVKTSKTIRNFKFDRDPTPDSLYDYSVRIYIEIVEERHMEH